MGDGGGEGRVCQLHKPFIMHLICSGIGTIIQHNKIIMHNAIILPSYWWGQAPNFSPLGGGGALNIMMKYSVTDVLSCSSFPVCESLIVMLSVSLAGV